MNINNYNIKNTDLKMKMMSSTRIQNFELVSKFFSKKTAFLFGKVDPLESKNLIKYLSMKHVNIFVEKIGKTTAFASLSIFVVAFFSILSGSLVAQPCPDDTEPPAFINCINRNITLGSGECATFLNPLLSATDDCTSGLVNLSANDDPETVTTGHGCMMGDAHYIQIYTPADLISYTPLSISEVTIGVGSSVNSPFVQVRIYKTDGTTNVANWEQIGSGSAILPDLVNSIYTINVLASKIQPDETFAIEIITPLTSVFGNVMGLNTSSNDVITYYYAPACGVNNLVDASSVITDYNPVFSFSGSFDPVFISKLPPTTQNYDEQFAQGVYNLGYLATDASGNSTSCLFNLVVNGPTGVISSIACNDLVNVSVDDQCLADVKADQILQGGPYGCYDNYIVEVYNQQNQPIGNLLGSQYVGQTLTVKVTGPNSNACWGMVKIEDKAPAVLECEPIYTTCKGALTPGAPLPQMITFKSDQSNIAIPASGISSKEATFNVFGLDASTITDVDVVLNIEHTSVSQLSAQIIAPDGTTVKLFTQPGGTCTGDNLMLTMNDQAMNSYALLQAACDTINVPAISGSYKPQQNLSAFNGKKPNGVWKVRVTDLTNGDGGKIVDVKIVFKQTGGVLSFPSPNPVTFTSLGGNNYLVNGIDPCGPLTMGYEDQILSNDCSSIYAQVIKRTWNAIDAYGNHSTSCDQYIYVFRNDLATLQFPPNYDGIQNNTLPCAQYGMQVPSPDVTGYPTGDFCSNVQIFPYEDQRIDICEKSYKILRKWKLLEWCSGEVLEHIQIIKVVDDQSPVLTCPANVTISADPLECTADYSPEKPIIVSECSSTITYLLSYYIPDATGTLPNDAIFITDNVVNNTTITGLYGKTFIKWIVIDNCGNRSTCTSMVTVADFVPPVAVCDQFTKVSIGSDGFAEVDAFTFDDGSHDNCALDKYEARKMTNKCTGGTTTQFREKILFCCMEVGTTIMVEFRVTDVSGNSNTCMVEIKVEDKLPPYITKCPADITLNCQADYLDLTVTGEPVFIDNCGVTSVNYLDSGSINQCGEGTITRTWTVKDAVGLSGSCVQRIRLIDNDPFDAFDIIWAPDYDASTCNSDLSPDNLPAPYNYPKISDDACSLTSATYKDQVFTFVDGACEKILRTWTVIDWCTYNQNTGAGLYTDLQIIKLTNNIKPVFTNCKDVTVDVFDDCRGLVEQTTEATDDCTPSDKLKYSYTIDLYNDGIPDPTYSGTGKTFSKTLPIGKHKVEWKVEDNCSNREYCTYILTVRDGKKPTPYCLSVVASVIMPSNGMLTIWAKDFDLGSYDNCTPREKLKISFSADTTFKSITYKCTDIPDGISTLITVKMWVTDEAGNQDYCTVQLNLQDGTGDACEDHIGSRVAIGGHISTPNHLPFPNVDVNLMDSEVSLMSNKSTASGDFMLQNVETSREYDILPKNNGDINNGVSTMDLVLIQRHILTVTPFDTPYKIIAADVTNDEKVTAADLVALRKVILGLTNTFPNGQRSWRFLTKENYFLVPSKPFPFLERYEYRPLAHDMFNQDYTAVKIGDVNNTVIPGFTGNSAENRNASQISYTIQKEGANQKINFYAENVDQLYGMQFSLSGLNAVAMESGLLTINSDYYTIDDNGNISVSISYPNAINVSSDLPLFSIVSEASANVVPALNTAISPELYSEINAANKIALAQRNGGEELESFEIFQNEPNPFADMTSIGFRIPEAGEVKLTISTVEGRLIYTTSQHFEKGIHSFTLDQSKLGVNGVMYYQVESGQNRAIRKMVSLK